MRHARAERQLRAGTDPIAEKAKANSRACSVQSGCAADVCREEKANSAVKKHTRPIPPRASEQYAFPILGSLSVRIINTDLVMQVLRPIWESKRVTASRLRGRVEAVLNFAKAHELRDGENPARWRGHLDHLLPAARARRPKHHAALPHVEVATFLSQLRTVEGPSARCLEIRVSTAVRSNEAIKAQWDEIDFGNGMWTVPASRTKRNRELRVPLCAQAISLLRSLPRVEGCEFVFIGARWTGSIGEHSLLNVLRDMKRSDVTAHGFRSSFRDWAAEATNYPREMCEISLGHAVGSATELAYRRSDLVEKRRQLMQDWAAYCEQSDEESKKARKQELL